MVLCPGVAPKNALGISQFLTLLFSLHFFWTMHFITCSNFSKVHNMYVCMGIYIYIIYIIYIYIYNVECMIIGSFSYVYVFICIHVTIAKTEVL